jgi:ABC-type sugar transport system substrate-binding protein
VIFNAAMNQRMLRLAAWWLCMVACATAACRQGTSGASGHAGSIKLAFVTNNAADFWTIARRGVEKADAELPDVETEFRLTSDGTAAEQQRIVDDLLTKRVTGIAISPVDPANQVAMINAAAAASIVFTQDSDAPDSQRMLYIGTDNLAAGRQAGQLIRDAVPGGGDVMLFVGKLDAKVGKVKIIAFDEADETLAGIRAGAIDATVVQQPFEFGYQAIQKMAQAARGDRSFIPASKRIIVPTLIVNRSNVEAFTKQINELRGRTR